MNPSITWGITPSVGPKAAKVTGTDVAVGVGVGVRVGVGLSARVGVAVGEARVKNATRVVLSLITTVVGFSVEAVAPDHRTNS